MAGATQLGEQLGEKVVALSQQLGKAISAKQHTN